MSLAAKVATATFAVIALGLLLSKPTGTQTLFSSGADAYATGVKAYTAF